MSSCAEQGPRDQRLLDEPVGLGGSREALPDQHAAYQAFSTRQASWDAPARKSTSK